MPEDRTSSRPRRRLPGLPNTRVPRSYDKWIRELLYPSTWSDSCGSDVPWLALGRQIADKHGCSLVYDTSRHWKESMYFPSSADHGPVVCVGGTGDHIDSCSAFLHELGHHMLYVRAQHSTRTLAAEEAAWRVAHELALEHRLPLNPGVRRTALYSYRYAQQLAASSGSRGRTRKRPAPRSWRLETSRRSANASTRYGIESIGKKGRRHTKRYIKRATARKERRDAGGPAC